MPQIFHRSMNTVARVTIFGAAFFLAAILWFLYAIVRSPYVTEAGVIRDQPVPFSHQHHVGGNGIDCRYCHTSVEQSAFAGMPTTKTCMNCHAYLWVQSPELEPVRESFRTGRPIRWTRVHDLPDFAYFNHAIHVNKGVACVTCHGQVDEMPLMWREHALHMQWCLDCHRNPRPNIRPRDEVFNMDWTPPDDIDSLRDQLLDYYHVQSKTDCYICHR